MNHYNHVSKALQQNFTVKYNDIGTCCDVYCGMHGGSGICVIFSLLC